VVALGGLEVVCLILDPRITGSNPADDDGFLRVIKICITTSLRGEVKPSVASDKILQLFKKPMSMKEILGMQNSEGISSPSFSASLLDVSAGNCQRTLWMDHEGSEIRWGRTIDQKWLRCYSCLVHQSHKDKEQLNLI
jgi:hypothetical protein